MEPGEPNPSLPHKLLSIVRELLPIMTALIGGLWIAGTYLHEQGLRREQEATQYKQQVQANEKERALRLFEARKLYSDRQLQLYFEVSNVIGKMLTADLSSSESDALFNRFAALEYSEIIIVDAGPVAGAMKDFENAAQLYQK